MVEDSIRRILPTVMTEVLLKTIANANVIQEQGERTPRQIAQTVEKYERLRDEQSPAYRSARNVPEMKRPGSLRHLLDPEAGADFYQDPRAAMAEATREEPQPRGQVVAERIQNLPAELQSLAEGMDLNDDGGEMWDDGDSIVPSSGMGPPLEHAAQQAGLDFSRMRQAINLTERKSPKVSAGDKAAQAQFEHQRLKMMRDRLDAK